MGCSTDGKSRSGRAASRDAPLRTASDNAPSHFALLRLTTLVAQLAHQLIHCARPLPARRSARRWSGLRLRIQIGILLCESVDVAG